MKQNNIREVLSHHPIIPVINFNHIDEVIPMIQKLKAKNIYCIEITLRTPIAFDAIRLAKEKLFPNNNLQERSLNFLQLCKNGEISSFIETIFQTIDPFNSDILILTEEHEAK